MVDVWPIVTLFVGFLGGISGEILRTRGQASTNREAVAASRRDRYLELKQAALIDFDETLQRYAAEVVAIEAHTAGLGDAKSKEERRLMEDALGDRKMASWPTALRLRAAVARIADPELTDLVGVVLTIISQGHAVGDPSFIASTDAAHRRSGILLKQLADER